jgi:hypothetical protein
MAHDAHICTRAGKELIANGSVMMSSRNGTPITSCTACSKVSKKGKGPEEFHEEGPLINSAYKWEPLGSHGAWGMQSATPFSAGLRVPR